MPEAIIFYMSVKRSTATAYCCSAESASGQQYVAVSDRLSALTLGNSQSCTIHHYQFPTSPCFWGQTKPSLLSARTHVSFKMFKQGWFFIYSIHINGKLYDANSLLTTQLKICVCQKTRHILFVTMYNLLSFHFVYRKIKCIGTALKH